MTFKVYLAEVTCARIVHRNLEIISRSELGKRQYKDASMALLKFLRFHIYYSVLSSLVVC